MIRVGISTGKGTPIEAISHEWLRICEVPTCCSPTMALDRKQAATEAC